MERQTQENQALANRAVAMQQRQILQKPSADSADSSSIKCKMGASLSNTTALGYGIAGFSLHCPQREVSEGAKQWMHRCAGSTIRLASQQTSHNCRVTQPIPTSYTREEDNKSTMARAIIISFFFFWR